MRLGRVSSHSGSVSLMISSAHDGCCARSGERLASSKSANCEREKRRHGRVTGSRFGGRGGVWTALDIPWQHCACRYDGYAKHCHLLSFCRRTSVAGQDRLSGGAHQTQGRPCSPRDSSRTPPPAPARCPPPLGKSRTTAPPGRRAAHRGGARSRRGSRQGPCCDGCSLRAPGARVAARAVKDAAAARLRLLAVHDVRPQRRLDERPVFCDLHHCDSARRHMRLSLLPSGGGCDDCSSSEREAWAHACERPPEVVVPELGGADPM